MTTPEKELYPPFYGVAAHLASVNPPEGLDRVSQLKFLFDSMVVTVDKMLIEQNNKIERLAEISLNKADNALVESLIGKIDTLLQEARALMNIRHHEEHHHHEPKVSTVQDLVDSGRAHFDIAPFPNDNAILMVRTVGDDAQLFDIIRDEYGLPIYKPFNYEADKTELGKAAIEAYRKCGLPTDQLLYISFILITNEPLNENSVQVPGKTTLS